MNEFRALIIEDNIDQVIVFTEAIRAAGFAVSDCTHGDKALEMIRAKKPHLIVLDLHLPGLDGDHILQQIRSDGNLAHILVILATADAAWAEMLEKESYLTLVKPISFIQLRGMAKRIYTHLEEQKAAS